MAAGRWVGRGDKNGADGVAVNAMRTLINTVQMNGVVVIGEGEKDEAPMLFNGEHVGDGTGPECDVAVDPIDGTTLTAKSLPNAVSVMAVAPRGSMYDPSAVFYMEKLIAGPEAADVVDIRLPVAENIALVAKAKGISQQRRHGLRARPSPPPEPRRRDPRRRRPHQVHHRRRRRRRHHRGASRHRRRPAGRHRRHPRGHHHGVRHQGDRRHDPGQAVADRRRRAPARDRRGPRPRPRPAHQRPGRRRRLLLRRDRHHRRRAHGTASATAPARPTPSRSSCARAAARSARSPASTSSTSCRRTPRSTTSTERRAT